MSVTRYDMRCIDLDNWDMSEYDYGNYVLFDDYEQLASEYDDLKEKYDTFVAKIYGVYMEA